MRVQLQKGKSYRATLVLHGAEDFAPNEAVAGKFSDAGFTHVSVTGHFAHRTATGTWYKDDITVETQNISQDIVNVVTMA
jgi:hypothetical protein